MIIRELFGHLGAAPRRGLVFAAGGSADIILAKTIATGLIGQGCARVDLVQPLNCARLSEKGLTTKAGEAFALVPEADLDPQAVLRHRSVVSCETFPDHRRGKGITISAALKWEHGERYVGAAHGDGLALLAARREGGRPFYDFAIGVDGGGDVLTHDHTEFDRVVVDGFRCGWDGARPAILVAMGLGADGGSAPAEFDDILLEGWTQLESVVLDEAFAAALHADLEYLGLWHPNPAGWRSDDPYWGYGFKVPQIIAMAVRQDFPFADDRPGSGLVRFPRRRVLKPMNPTLLREARLFLREAD